METSDLSMFVLSVVSGLSFQRGCYSRIILGHVLNSFLGDKGDLLGRDDVE